MFLCNHVTLFFILDFLLFNIIPDWSMKYNIWYQVLFRPNKGFFNRWTYLMSFPETSDERKVGYPFGHRRPRPGFLHSCLWWTPRCVLGSVYWPNSLHSWKRDQNKSERIQLLRLMTLGKHRDPFTTCSGPISRSLWDKCRFTSLFWCQTRFLKTCWVQIYSFRATCGFFGGFFQNFCDFMT